MLPRQMSSSGIVLPLGQFPEAGLADLVSAADRLFDMEMKAHVTGQDLQPIGVSLAASIRPSWPVDGVIGTGGHLQGDVFLVDVDIAHSTTFTPAVLASLSSLEYATCDIANIPIKLRLSDLFFLRISKLDMVHGNRSIKPEKAVDGAIVFLGNILGASVLNSDIRKTRRSGE